MKNQYMSATCPVLSNFQLLEREIFGNEKADPRLRISVYQKKKKKESLLFLIKLDRKIQMYAWVLQKSLQVIEG